jgi:hypothetical protein
MRHDAEFVGCEEISKWIISGECPYRGRERDYIFDENPEVWEPGEPKLRGMELFKALCEEREIKI